MTLWLKTNTMRVVVATRLGRKRDGWMDGNAASGFNYLSPGMSRILVRPVQFTSRS